jgi:hypothetical protein
MAPMARLVTMKVTAETLQIARELAYLERLPISVAVEKALFEKFLSLQNAPAKESRSTIYNKDTIEVKNDS